MFRAYQPEQDRLVAVKLFRLDLPPERVHQLVAELERLIAADLSHPAIAAPVAAGMAGVEAYLALDFVAADSLDVVVRDSGPTSLADVMRIVTQLAGALDFAAEHDLVHGALHPRDVLMSADDVRMTGLGISRALERVGQVAPLRRPYAAPERVAGGAWDRAADIFSLGALAFELIVGRRVSGTGEQATADLGDLPNVDVLALQPVLARALADDPLDRYAQAGAFADGLQRVLHAAVPSRAPRRRKKFGSEASVPAPVHALPLALEGASASDAAVDAARPDAAHRDTTGADDRERAVDPATDLPEPEADAARLSAAGARSALADIRLAFDGAGVTIDEVQQAVEMRVEPEIGSRRTTRDLELSTEAEPAMHAARDSESALGEWPLGEAGHVEKMELPAHAVLRDDVRGEGPMARSARALERTRSALWPLLLALVVGVAIGFGIAMAVLGRDQAFPDAPQVAQGSSLEGSRSTPPTEISEPALRLPNETAAPAAPDAPAAAPAPAPPAAATRTPTARVPTPVAPPRAPAVDTGRLLVRSSPAGARVMVDGKDVGVTPVTLRDVNRGAHTVRLTHEGYRSTERRVTISATRPSQSLQLDLVRERTEPARARSGEAGSILVDSRPSGASVFIDGRLVGRTPVVLPAVAAGEHALHLEHEGYRRWASSVRVTPGEQSKVTGSLER